MESNYDPLDTQGLEQQQSEKAKQVKSSEQIEIDDLKWILSNRRGRRFAAQVMGRSGVWRSSFNSDPLLMAYNEGAKSTGLRLVETIMTHCPARFLEILENK